MQPGLSCHPLAVFYFVDVCLICLSVLDVSASYPLRKGQGVYITCKKTLKKNRKAIPSRCSNKTSDPLQGPNRWILEGCMKVLRRGGGGFKLSVKLSMIADIHSGNLQNWEKRERLKGIESIRDNFWVCSIQVITQRPCKWWVRGRTESHWRNIQFGHVP